MFVLTNVAMPRNELPFVVHEDIVLREATDKEIALFEEALENTYGFLCSRIADPTKKYKGHVITNGEGNLRLTDEGYQGRKRLWVIAYHGVNDRNNALERVGLLTDPQLIVGFTYICFKRSGLIGRAKCWPCFISEY